MKYLAMVIILVSSSLSSCKKDKTDYTEKRNQRLITEQNLIKKYGIEYNWSNLSYDLTYQYKSVLKSEKQIITYPELLDIYEKNGATYIRIRSELDKVFYFDLKVQNSLVDEIIKDYNSDNYLMNCVLIVKIDDIQKTPFICKPYSEITEGKIEYSYIELEENNSFIGNGQIINLQFL